MKMKIYNKNPMYFTFDDTKHKLGMQIWGDRESFLQLHQLLGDCWECADIEMTDAEKSSYIGVISYFSHTIRHAFLGNRLVMMDGMPLEDWDTDIYTLFEEQQERFMVGMDFAWPQMLCIMAAWWECFRRKECPPQLMPVMRAFTQNIERLMKQRSKTQFPHIEPYLHGAIYAANPYLMHTMESIHVDYLRHSRYGRVRLDSLADMMRMAVYGTWEYKDEMDRFRKLAKQQACPIESIRLPVDDSLYNINL